MDDMTFPPLTVVTWEPRELWIEDVPDALDAIREGWTRFEGQFPSLRGRKMLGFASGPPESGETYRLASFIREDDPETIDGLTRITEPFGTYRRCRVTAEPPGLYDLIGPAMDHARAASQDDIDWSRPTIEFYNRRDVVDCLVPIRSTEG